MADGKEIITASAMDPKQHPDRVLDSDLQIVKADGSNIRRFLDLPDYAVFAALPSPDGKSIAFIATSLKDQGYEIPVLGTISASGSNPSLITKELDREVNDFIWSGDSKSLYFIASVNGGFPLYRINSSGGKPQQLTEGNTGVRNVDVGKSKVVFALTQSANPFELYSTTLDGSGIKQLTNHNAQWLASKKLSTPTAHQLTRSDGTVVEYWIMKPANFESGKKYPLLVEMHGGPSAMWGPGEETMWHEFQMFCARGYGIVYANPRGSGGYGYKHLHGNYQNWGEGPGSDVLAAATEAAKEPWVDADRQVLTGGSYAGYLTAWIVGHDHRFKAAVSQRGVYSLPVFMGEGLAWRLVPDHFGGYPWQPEIKTILDRESPISYVDQITTPLLIKHDDLDLRAGVIQSEMLYKSLKILNKPVEYVRYPKASHDLSRTGNPKQRMDRLLRILEFFERYIH
jgi:dipeptidyl aminopeptidase/acylaminoacyl peptidase